MDRRVFLKGLAALGVGVPAAALAERASERVIDAASRGLDGTEWWRPVFQTWCRGERSSALDALCDALEVPEVLECTRADVAIARLLLGPIQDELPSWSILGDEGLMCARPPFPAAPGGAPLFAPTHLATIDWASSGPGFSWPEAYYATVIPPLGIVVVTGSRDSEEPLGCTDHAYGWRPATRPLRAIAREVLVADWTRTTDASGAPAWESIFLTGLLGRRTLMSMRRQVWDGRDQDE